jgi:hypothetical protein
LNGMTRLFASPFKTWPLEQVDGEAGAAFAQSIWRAVQAAARMNFPDARLHSPMRSDFLPLYNTSPVDWNVAAFPGQSRRVDSVMGLATQHMTLGIHRFEGWCREVHLPTLAPAWHSAHSSPHRTVHRWLDPQHLHQSGARVVRFLVSGSLVPRMPETPPRSQPQS